MWAYTPLYRFCNEFLLGSKYAKHAHDTPQYRLHKKTTRSDTTKYRITKKVEETGK